MKLGWAALFLAVIVGTGLILAWPALIPAPLIYGVSFSPRQAEGLGLAWREVYAAILEDLGVRRLRLNAYWTDIEPADSEFDFSDLDWQMDEAANAGARVILTVGRKLPRWPECHVPEWARTLPESVQQEQALEAVRQIVSRYRSHQALSTWQVENEFFFTYGECPPPEAGFLVRELELIRSLDPVHPMMITDSGELSSWLQAAYYGDVLGTTMYRSVYFDKRGQYGHYDYLFPAWLYRAKTRLVKLLYGRSVIVSELQGEPWGPISFTELSRADREKTFSLARFLDIQDFVVRTQLPEAYWWGVEYWYWEKEHQNNPVFWETAKKLF